MLTCQKKFKSNALLLSKFRLFWGTNNLWNQFYKLSYTHIHLKYGLKKVTSGIKTEFTLGFWRFSVKYLFYLFKSPILKCWKMQSCGFNRAKCVTSVTETCYIFVTIGGDNLYTLLYSRGLYEFHLNLLSHIVWLISTCYRYVTCILWIQTQLVVDHNGLDDHRINLYKTNRIKDLLWKLDLKYPR